MSAIHSDSNRAISAAASAGTTSNVRVPGVSTPMLEPATIMTKLTNTVAITQVTVPEGEGREPGEGSRPFVLRRRLDGDTGP